MDFSLTYDIIYSLAAREGREDALFGDNASLAHEAFVRSAPCDTFPELWFELPLIGEPWFDLHVLTERESLKPGMAFSAEQTGGNPDVFDWFSRQSDVRQLALSWDIGSRGATSPAVQLLMRRRNLAESSAFFEAVGRAEAVEGYRTFVGRLPKGWFACYAGTFPHRPGAPIRVECIPTFDQQQAYAQDASLLENDLRSVGLTELGDTLIPRSQLFAQSPFHLEFQFDITDDGWAGSTLGASVRFPPPTPSQLELSFDAQGATADLMCKLEEWGLADDRWPLLKDAMFSKRITSKNESFLLYCFPAFIKLRWRDGVPVDAKTYLMAGLQ